MKEGHSNRFVFHNIFIWDTVFSVALLIRYLIGFHRIWIHPNFERYYFAVNFNFFCPYTSAIKSREQLVSYFLRIVKFLFLYTNEQTLTKTNLRWVSSNWGDFTICFIMRQNYRKWLFPTECVVSKGYVKRYADSFFDS